jgi:hypothetical protein
MKKPKESIKKHEKAIRKQAKAERKQRYKILVSTEAKRR